MRNPIFTQPQVIGLIEDWNTAHPIDPALKMAPAMATQTDQSRYHCFALVISCIGRDLRGGQFLEAFGIFLPPGGVVERITQAFGFGWGVTRTAGVVENRRVGGDWFGSDRRLLGAPGEQEDDQHPLHLGRPLTT